MHSEVRCGDGLVSGVKAVLEGQRFISNSLRECQTYLCGVGAPARGTRTSITVPLFGFDSIVIDPFTSRMRSRMLVRPRPLPTDAALRSKPLPGSLTIK